MAHILTDYGLVDLGCESSLRRNTQRPVSYLTTLGGVTKAQVGPRTSRVWDLSLPSTSTPDEYAALHALVEGEYGTGPWGFVSDVAKVTNLMSPQASLLKGHAGTDSVTLDPQVGIAPAHGFAGFDTTDSPEAKVASPVVATTPPPPAATWDGIAESKSEVTDNDCTS